MKKPTSRVEPGFTALDEALENVRRLARPRSAREMNTALADLVAVVRRDTFDEVRRGRKVSS